MAAILECKIEKIQNGFIQQTFWHKVRSILVVYRVGALGQNIWGPFHPGVLGLNMWGPISPRVSGTKHVGARLIPTDSPEQSRALVVYRVGVLMQPFGTPPHRVAGQPTRPRESPYMVRVLEQPLEHHTTELQGHPTPHPPAGPGLLFRRALTFI